MTVTMTDYTQYVDKRVILTVKSTDDEGQPTAQEITGTVMVANETGILLKPKGKTQPEIYEPNQIEEIQLSPEADKKINPKYISDVELGKARSHLLERHGATLTEVNSMTEESAFAFHGEIDHEEADLGHRHGEKPKREKKADKADAPLSDEPDSVDTDDEPDF